MEKKFILKISELPIKISFVIILAVLGAVSCEVPHNDPLAAKAGDGVVVCTLSSYKNSTEEASSYEYKQAKQMVKNNDNLKKLALTLTSDGVLSYKDFCLIYKECLKQIENQKKTQARKEFFEYLKK